MRGAAGYSLLELLVVLAIMGLIAAVAAPSVIGSVDRVTLTADARAVATQLRAWRNVALDGQTEVEVTTAGRRVTASTGDSLDLSSGTVADASLVISPVGASSGAIRLTRGASSIKVSVDAITGRVTVVQGPP